MFDTAKFQQILREAFAGFERHSDFALVRSAIRNAISPFDTLNTQSAHVMGTILRNEFIGALEQAEQKQQPGKRTPMTRAEKVFTYLKAVEGYPKLLERLSAGFSTISLRYKFNAAQAIPALDELRRYPEMETGRKRYIAACITKFPQGLPHIAKQIQGTPDAALVTPDAIKAYRNTFEILNSEQHPLDFAALKSMPALWSAFERTAEDLQVFAAYAPFVKQDLVFSDSYIVGSDYNLSYDESSHIMTINFSLVDEEMHTSGWVTEIDDKCLQSTYILLNHALGVLNGSRKGHISTNQAWIDMQSKELTPILQRDIFALKLHMQGRGYGVPYTPVPMIPQI